MCKRRVRSDSVQSDQKSVQEEAEEETESIQDKKLPGVLTLCGTVLGSNICFD